jgi:hypothetical protein
MSQLLAGNRYLSSYYDDKFVAQSILFWLFGTSLVLAFWRPAPRASEARTALKPG